MPPNNNSYNTDKIFKKSDILCKGIPLLFENEDDIEDVFHVTVIA